MARATVAAAVGERSSMKKIFFIMALCFFIPAHAVIVFLQGAGCAGKTSLCRELLQNNASWKLVDEDALYIERAIQFWADTFPAEFQSIEAAIAYENIYHAVKHNQTLFKESATAQEKMVARIAIYSIKTRLAERTADNDAAYAQWKQALAAQVFADTISHAQQGFNVVVDNWGLKPEHYDALEKEYDVVRVLAYCPLRELVNRTIRRNSDALLTRNLHAMRYFHQPLLSYLGLYDFEEQQSDRSIDVISREDINNALDVVELALSVQENFGITNGFSRAEFSRSQLHEYRVNFMKKFGNRDVLYVVPKNKIDICIRTDDHGGSTAAQRFAQAIESFQ